MSDPTLPACEPNPTEPVLEEPGVLVAQEASSFGAVESLVECAILSSLSERHLDLLGFARLST